SGSTGLPKGVMVEHRGLCNYLSWASAAYAPVKSAIVSSSFSVDATVTSLYTPLLNGGVVHLLPEREGVDGLNRRLSSPECSMVKITPTHMGALAQNIIPGGLRSSLDLFVIGGEMLSPSTVRQWRQARPHLRMVNEYGPTETVVGCMMYSVDEEFNLTQTVPIGRPIWNTQIYLLDRYGQP
ncbi:AMP-binding protein, partial [Dokdonella soli]